MWGNLNTLCIKQEWPVESRIHMELIHMTTTVYISERGNGVKVGIGLALPGRISDSEKSRMPVSSSR